MKKRFEILVVGAGVTGLAVAAMLAQCRNRDRLRVTVADAEPRPQYDPGDDVALRVSAIAAGSAALLDAAGVWPRVVATRACAYDRMRVWDADRDVGGPSTLRFDAADFAVPQLGFIVENVLLRHALLGVLDRLDVALEFGTVIDSPTGDLVVAADGASSRLRASAGIAVRSYPYSQTAVVTHLQPENPHRNTAWQRFLRDGPLGILPLADGRVSVVWSTSETRAAEALAASGAELGRLITDASDRVLGRLEVAGPRGAFPLCALHAERYVQRGLALVGDAAHAVHPLAGQGANLGLRDAGKLAEVIDGALDRNEHPGDKPVLRRYERARKGDNATMLHFMTGLNRLFATDSTLAAELRAAGMRLFNASGPIRACAVKVALGV